VDYRAPYVTGYIFERKKEPRMAPAQKAEKNDIDFCFKA
jgi:hypothetical protein